MGMRAFAQGFFRGASSGVKDAFDKRDARATQKRKEETSATLLAESRELDAKNRAEDNIRKDIASVETLEGAKELEKMAGPEHGAALAARISALKRRNAQTIKDDKVQEAQLSKIGLEQKAAEATLLRLTGEQNEKNDETAFNNELSSGGGFSVDGLRHINRMGQYYLGEGELEAASRMTEHLDPGGRLSISVRNAKKNEGARTIYNGLTVAMNEAPALNRLELWDQYVESIENLPLPEQAGAYSIANMMKEGAMLSVDQAEGERYKLLIQTFAPNGLDKNNTPHVTMQIKNHIETGAELAAEGAKNQALAQGREQNLDGRAMIELYKRKIHNAKLGGDLSKAAFYRDIEEIRLEAFGEDPVLAGEGPRAATQKSGESGFLDSDIADDVSSTFSGLFE